MQIFYTTLHVSLYVPPIKIYYMYTYLIKSAFSYFGIFFFFYQQQITQNK